MYFKYAMTAIAVILLSEAFLYALLKRKSLLNKKNKVNLMACTVLAVVCAVFTPFSAKLMVQKLYFSIFTAVALSFILFTTLSGVVYYFLKKHLKVEETDGQADMGEQVRDFVEEVSAAQFIESVHEDFVEEAEAKLEPKSELELELESESESESESDIEIDSHIENSDEHEALILEAAESNTEALAVTHAQTNSEVSPTLSDLLEEASACKNNHELQKAIFLYESALLQNPESNLLMWIVIDLCSLYKMTNQQKLIYKTLGSEYCNLLNNHIKEDILRNI